MPIYEYQCTQCSERHEAIQRFSDPPVEHCPKCGGSMKKLFSSPAIQFKGSGFYKTDYASGSSSLPSKGDHKGEKGGDSKSESSSDSKSESKSDGGSKSESKSESGSKQESKSPSKSESKGAE
jgi:putative FmdB family regulatory protein